MILIGQYDSPFVRRVAIALNHHGIVFERRVLSVFADFDEMLEINPLGKVPVVELDGGERLFDSRAILDYVDGLVGPQARLVPSAEPHRREVLRVDAIALGLAEKLYERGIEFVRKARGSADPVWTERLKRQIQSATSWLEAQRPLPFFCGDRLSLADISTAVAFTFLKEKQSALFSAGAYPLLEAHCDFFERLHPFSASPYSAKEASDSGWFPTADRGP